MHEDRLAIRRPCGAQLFAVALIKIAIHKVRDHFDRPLDLEFSQRTVAKVVRNCRDAVTLLDAETGDREIAAVVADKRYVSAMQRRHEGEASGGGHLPGKQRA